MKKITLLLSALMIAGVTFAHDGKSCCKGNKGKCSKESACCKDKAHCKKECSKDATMNSNNKSGTSKSTTPPSPKA